MSLRAVLRTALRASVAMSPSTMALRPARWMSCAALRMMPAQAAFSVLPTSPTTLIFLVCLFNQRQKFLIAGRSEQGRFNHIAPAKASLRGNKFAKLAQDAFMNGRIGDDAVALVGF